MPTQVGCRVLRWAGRGEVRKAEGCMDRCGAGILVSVTPDDPRRSPQGSF